MAANKLRAIQGARQRLDTPAALAKFVSALVQDVLDGTVPVSVGRTALYGLNIQHKLIESTELERRIAALEARVGQQERSPWRA